MENKKINSILGLNISIKEKTFIEELEEAKKHILLDSITEMKYFERCSEIFDCYDENDENYLNVLENYQLSYKYYIASKRKIKEINDEIENYKKFGGELPF